MPQQERIHAVEEERVADPGDGSEYVHPAEEELGPVVDPGRHPAFIARRGSVRSGVPGWRVGC